MSRTEIRAKAIRVLNEMDALAAAWDWNRAGHCVLDAAMLGRAVADDPVLGKVAMPPEHKDQMDRLPDLIQQGRMQDAMKVLRLAVEDVEAMTRGLAMS